jgi:hypothetical protein
MKSLAEEKFEFDEHISALLWIGRAHVSDKANYFPIWKYLKKCEPHRNTERYANYLYYCPQLHQMIHLFALPIGIISIFDIECSTHTIEQDFGINAYFVLFFTMQTLWTINTWTSIAVELNIYVTNVLI